MEELFKKIKNEERIEKHQLIALTRYFINLRKVPIGVLYEDWENICGVIMYYRENGDITYKQQTLLYAVMFKQPSLVYDPNAPRYY